VQKRVGGHRLVGFPDIIATTPNWLRGPIQYDPQNLVFLDGIGSIVALIECPKDLVGRFYSRRASTGAVVSGSFVEEK